MAFSMNFGDCGIHSLFSPPVTNSLFSPPVTDSSLGRFNSLDISSILYSNDERQTQRKKKPAADKPRKRKAKTVRPTDNSPFAKVKIKIFLEKFDSGVFVTRVKVGERVRWQNVKYEKQALRYHPALKRFQSVMSAVDTVKLHKTLQISLTRNEAERYKTGDLLEGKEKSQLKPKESQLKHKGVKYQQIQVNNYYQINNYMGNAGPSTSTQSIAEISESDYSSDQINFSDYSTD